MPPTLVDVKDNPSVLQDTGGKTPLILVHGTQVPGETRRFANLSFAPAICTWENFVDNFTAEANLNQAHKTLTDEYALFAYEYE